MSPSIRFLFLVVAGWIALRSAGLVMMPQPAPALERESPATVTAAAPRDYVELPTPALPPAVLSPAPFPRPQARASFARSNSRSLATAPPVRAFASAAPFLSAQPSPFARPSPSAPPPVSLATSAASAPAASRLSIAAWGLIRPSLGADTLASGGTLGGSQAGARLRYGLIRNFAASLRASAPLNSGVAGEVAAGVTVTPSARVPLHLTFERRQRMGSGGGRSAFALFAEGGTYARQLPLDFRLDAYAQAGIVGARRRDPFADGAVGVTRPVTGNFSAGAGVWAGAQPGLSRVDVGPRLTLRLTPRSRLDLDWRQRVAGNAKPSSGPALTIAGDF